MASQQQVKTFVPQTPVQFDSDLLSQLTTTNESSYARQQLSESYIQKEVSKRLSQLQKSKLQDLDSNLNASLLKEATSKDATESVAAVNQRLSELQLNLQKLNDSRVTKSEELLSAEKQVTSCFLNNKGKVLNCWDEVETFKKLAAKQ
ncbi:unnamed protein product [Ambrosiozyma monospora]|uniref:Unnamed protein product n=1 Tax=Ambrosiozyma monospora TaxID=43982 RepID=A0A9W6Z5W7_AMBMO|nr:unnamed protein product [Ambrosiozyma monospora]